MTKSNQTKNPFLAFGTPSKVVINGIQEKNDEIIEAIDTLIAHKNEIVAFTLTRLNGKVSIYVVTV